MVFVHWRRVESFVRRHPRKTWDTAKIVLNRRRAALSAALKDAGPEKLSVG